VPPGKQAEWHCLGFIFVIMLKSWALSSSSPFVGHCTSPLCREDLHSVTGQTALQALDTRNSCMHSILPRPLIHFKIPTMPRWLIVIPHCDTRLCDLPKVCTPPDTFHRFCTEMFTHCLDHTGVFTDGYLMNGSTGCVFILSGRAFKYWLNSFSSSFTSKLLPLYNTLEAAGNLLPGTFCCVQTPWVQSNAYSLLPLPNTFLCFQKLS
jgi:hypothetical protein